ncbi:MAG: AAA family ATPase [Euryarchaeota archaeon]|nr:AAA family ATPase [Euryarchaeota archaeon]
MKILDVLLRHNGDVGLSIVYLVGMPGSGKTTLVKTLIAKIVQAVGRERIHYVRTRDIKDVFEHINPEKEFQLFFVDDAMMKQNARRSMSSDNIEIYERLPDVRHIAEERGLKEGKIIIFIAAQVPKGVDLVIRNFAKFTIFKSMNLYEEEHRRILKALEIPYYEVVDWIDGVLAEDPWALSRGLIITQSGRWGWLRFTPEDGVAPDVDNYFITPGEKEEKSEEKEEILTEDVNELIREELKKMKRSRKWKKKAELLERLMQGDTRLRLSQIYNIPESTVGYFANQAMGELRRRIGLKYEEVVVKKLEKMGFQNVRRMGGQSEPDILAEKDGEKYAVSVKLYNYGRARHSLPIDEFTPELKWAEENGGKAMLYYTNLAWSETYFFEIRDDKDMVTIKRRKGPI